MLLLFNRVETFIIEKYVLAINFVIMHCGMNFNFQMIFKYINKFIIQTIKYCDMGQLLC